MKFTAAVVASTIAAVSAFAPGATFVRPETALAGHALAGYRPGKNPPPAAAVSSSGVPGFSGFGAADSSSGVPGFSGFGGDAPAVAPVNAPIAGFSGFGHATGQMGGNPSFGKAFVSAPAPAAAPAAPPAPVFSGFGHATGQMGGNPAIITKKR